MSSTRSWFQKFRHREKNKVKSGTPTKREIEETTNFPAEDEAPSSATQQKVAAAKEYIENHYKAQMQCLQDRKERSAQTTAFNSEN